MAVSCDAIQVYRGLEVLSGAPSEEERERFLRNLLQEAKLIEIEETIQACRDPKDDKFLELAVNGNADCIVSGDDDLLTLGPFKSVAILTPNDFLDALSQRDG